MLFVVAGATAVCITTRARRMETSQALGLINTSFFPLSFPSPCLPLSHSSSLPPSLTQSLSLSLPLPLPLPLPLSLPLPLPLPPPCLFAPSLHSYSPLSSPPSSVINLQFHAPLEFQHSFNYIISMVFTWEKNFLSDLEGLYEAR